ncbi:MAG TPA: hypothetical protein VGK67_31450 [Myxococcales bacterium]|jgi:hypothetical protein
MHAKTLLSAGLALLLTAPVAASAAAKPAPSVRLVYSRAGEAESCPAEPAVRGAVAARLGTDPFREPAELIVRASLTSDAGTLRARIEVHTAAGEPRGSRELTSRASDCVELASSMDLAISIAIDPLAMVKRPPEPPPPAPKLAEPAPAPQACPATAPCPPCLAAAAPTAAPAPAPAAPSLAPPEPWQLQAHLGPLVNFGAAPGTAAFGATVGLELRRGAFLVGLEGRADFPSSAAFSGGSVGTSLLLLSAVPCWRASYFGVCAVLSGGAQRASSEGLPAARAVTAPYFAAGARLLGELPLSGPVSLRADAELKAALVRTTVRVGEQPAWSTPPVSGGLGVAAVIRFL